MNLPDPGFARIEELADELEDAGWPSVADDVREGVPLNTVLDRLAEIGETYSEATEIIIDSGLV